MKFSVVTPLWQDKPASENMEVALAADKLGYDHLWIGEMATFDAFAFATAVGLQTKNLSLTIGPLAVSVRTPTTIAMGAASVAELTGKRVGLAIGASSVVVVQEWHGRERKRTAKHLAETAQILKLLLAGEKAAFAGDLASCKGYRLRLDAPHCPLSIAAFGPAAVKAAGGYADQMLLNMVTPPSLANLKEQLADSAKKAGRTTPKIAVWLPAAVSPNRESIDQLKRGIVGYLAAPGYGEMMMEAGFGELVNFARNRPHPKDLLAAMPDELIQAIGLVGTPEEIQARVDAYAAAGADEICLVPATAGDPSGANTLTALRRAPR
ncbi:MAG: LLM class F420-dependent oxidoreductase [Halioglobus sp.]